MKAKRIYGSTNQDWVRCMQACDAGYKWDGDATAYLCLIKSFESSKNLVSLVALSRKIK